MDRQRQTRSGTEAAVRGLMIEIKKQSVVTLEIEDLAYGGEGIAKPEGFVVFVKDAIPGDQGSGDKRQKRRDSPHAAEIGNLQEQRGVMLRVSEQCPGKTGELARRRRFRSTRCSARWSESMC